MSKQTKKLTRTEALEQCLEIQEDGTFRELNHWEQIEAISKNNIEERHLKWVDDIGLEKSIEKLQEERSSKTSSSAIVFAPIQQNAREYLEGLINRRESEQKDNP